MFTVFAMFRKREEMTQEGFIDYYEGTRAKLSIGMPGLIRYTRYYLTAAPYPVGGAIAPLAYDVITELVLADREKYERAFEGGLSDPRIEALVIADEESLFDRRENRAAFVDSRTSELAPITFKSR